MNHHRVLFCLTLVVLLFVLSLGSESSLAQTLRVIDSQPAVLLNSDSARRREIAGHLRIYLDESGTKTLEQIQSLHPQQFVALDDVGEWEVSPDTSYWLYGRVRNSQRSLNPSLSDWRLVIPRYRIRESEFYLSQGDGRLQRYSELKGRYLVFPMPVSAKATAEFYLKLVPDGALNTPVLIWPAATYELHKRKSILGWGLFFGSLFALFLYNLLMFVSLRQSGYFYLSGFIGSAFVLTLVHEHFLVLVSPRLAAIVPVHAAEVLQCLVLIFASAFSRSYLTTVQRFPSIDKMITAVMVVSLLLVGVSFFQWISSQSFKVVFTLLSAGFFIPAVMASLQLSNRSSRFYLVGWSLFVAGYGIFQLGELNIIPSNDITMRTKEMTLCLLGVFLSLGIAAQIQRERFSKSAGLATQKQTMLELKYAEEQIQKKVLRDTLQGYPGVNVLGSVVNQSLNQLSEGKETLTLVLAELLHLDRVESQLGHTARNELVTRATRRLSIVLRSIVGVVPVSESGGQYIPMSVVVGGQYGFLLKGMDSVKVNLAVDEVEAAMQKPFYFQGVPLEPGVSFGVSSTQQVDTFESLYEHCQSSLEADKKRIRHKTQDVQFLNQYNARNIGLINQLREAIQEDELTLYFQSTFALQSHHVCGIEVLCRWDGLKDKIVNPHEIFYLAEVGGFVSDLTLRVIENAILYYQFALNQQASDVKISINLSPKCIRDGCFLEQVAVLLERHQFRGDLLAFEIKESAIIEDPSITRETLNQIRAMGIGLTIDEFGAAYSNPSYLSSLPVNEVKLDPRMVAQLDAFSNKQAVLDVIQICRKHNIQLVVHGVKDETTLVKLEAMGCSFAQGHYFAEPVPAEQYDLPKRDNPKSRYLKVS